MFRHSVITGLSCADHVRRKLFEPVLDLLLETSWQLTSSRYPTMLLPLPIS